MDQYLIFEKCSLNSLRFKVWLKYLYSEESRGVLPSISRGAWNIWERATVGIGLHVNAHKTEYMNYNQVGDISTLDGTSLKLIDKFSNLRSSVSSIEKDIDTRLTKVWTAIDKLSIIWKI